MTTYTLTVTDRGDVAAIAGGGVASVVVSDGTSGGTTGSVSSVNGHVGVVNLTATDVGADASGAAASALATAEAYTDTAVAGISGGTGTVDTVVAGTGISVDVTDPANPVVTNTGATSAQGALADSATQPADLATVATTGAYTDLTGRPTLGDAAAKNTGSSAGTLAAGDDSRITGAAQKSSNLGDLASTSSARTNLGLGTSATVDVPATGDAGTGQVVKGSDTRLTDSRTPTTHTHTASQISDSTTVGRAVVSAVDAAAGRTAIGAGTSSLAIGTTSSTAKAGDYQPASTNISDATTVGKAVLTGVDAAAVRTTLGLGTAATISATAGGDLSGTLPSPTVTKLNGTSLAGLATGLLKNTTTTGVPSIAVAADIPNIAESQVTNLVTDLAAKVPTTRTVNGKALSADITLAPVDIAPNTPNAQTGTTYTFVLADANRFTTASNASAQTYTIPPNSSVAFPVGSVLKLVQIGAGQVTVAQGAGVTVNATPGLKIAAQYGGCEAVKLATDTWVLVGRLSA